MHATLIAPANARSRASSSAAHLGMAIVKIARNLAVPSPSVIGFAWIVGVDCVTPWLLRCFRASLLFLAVQRSVSPLDRPAAVVAGQPRL